MPLWRLTYGKYDTCKFKIVKNILRTTISQDRLKQLFIMLCESDIEIDNGQVILLLLIFKEMFKFISQYKIYWLTYVIFG